MKVLLLLLLLSSNSVSLAATYLNIYGVSKHLDEIVTFNESNYGVGIEAEMSPTRSITVGSYRNSLNKQTIFLSYNAKSLPNSLGMSIGISGGVASGYEKPVVPIIYPFIDVFLFKVGYLPEIKGITPAVVFGSLKINFGE